MRLRRKCQAFRRPPCAELFEKQNKRQLELTQSLQTTLFSIPIGYEIDVGRLGSLPSQNLTQRIQR